MIASCRVEDILCNQISDKIELFVCFILQSCDRYSIWSSGGKREKFNQTKDLLINSVWVYYWCITSVLVWCVISLYCRIIVRIHRPSLRSYPQFVGDIIMMNYLTSVSVTGEKGENTHGGGSVSSTGHSSKMFLYGRKKRFWERL